MIWSDIRQPKSALGAGQNSSARRFSEAAHIRAYINGGSPLSPRAAGREPERGVPKNLCCLCVLLLKNPFVEFGRLSRGADSDAHVFAECDRPRSQHYPNLLPFTNLCRHPTRPATLFSSFRFGQRALIGDPFDGCEKPCLRRRMAVKMAHNHVQKVDATSLGPANRDCKERGVCQLTYEPEAIEILHTF